MMNTNELSLSVEDHEKAFTELSFLLEIFAVTIADLMGGATATVGRIAGRQISEKLPIYLPNPTTASVLEALVRYYRNGCDIGYVCDDEGATLTIKGCAIREVCKVRKRELGGDVCKMFHYAIAGIINRILDRPVKSTIESCGETCTARLEIR